MKPTVTLMRPGDLAPRDDRVWTLTDDDKLRARILFERQRYFNPPPWSPYQLGNGK